MSYKETEGKKPYQLIPEICLRALQSDSVKSYYKGVIEDYMLEYHKEIGEDSFADIVLPVLEFGIEKYGEPNSWKKVPNAQDEYSGALLRHLDAIVAEGVDSRAEDSGLYHIQHVLCNLMFLLWFELQESVQGVRYGSIEWHK